MTQDNNDDVFDKINYELVSLKQDFDKKFTNYKKSIIQNKYSFKFPETKIKNFVCSIAFNNENLLAPGHADGSIPIWNTEHGITSKRIG